MENKNLNTMGRVMYQISSVIYLNKCTSKQRGKKKNICKNLTGVVDVSLLLKWCGMDFVMVLSRMQVSFECYVGIRILYMGQNRIRVWQRLMDVILVGDWKK